MGVLARYWGVAGGAGSGESLVMDCWWWIAGGGYAGASLGHW